MKTTVFVKPGQVAIENADKPTQACVAKGETEFLSLVNEVIKENQDNGNFDIIIK